MSLIPDEAHQRHRRDRDAPAADPPDFYGSPEALFDVQYPAPGLPEIADEVSDVVSPDLGRCATPEPAVQ